MHILTGAALLAATFTPAGPLASPPGALPSPWPCTRSTPYTAGDDGYAAFRIPALARADGVLLAFAEGRRNGPADYGDIDVVVRRSLDGGCSWGPLQVVADNGTDTAGNPAPVVDPTTHRVLLLTMRQPGTEDGSRDRRVFLQSSDDQGASWTTPREITSQVKRDGWVWYATGPGHGVALLSGRLVVPADHSADGGRVHGSHLLLSDDHGRSWRIGAVDDHADGVVNPDETTAAQLPDGRLYLNTRDQYGTSPATRAFTYSEDDGESFTAPFRPLPELTAPVVQGSVLQMGSPHCRPLLFSAPQDPARRRELTVRRSEDGGLTWAPEAEITDGPAGYSDLVEVGPSVAGVLYETGEQGPYERIDFRLLPVGCGAED